MKEFLNAAIEAAQLGGDVLMEHLGKLKEQDIHEKKAYDFVTYVDMESEKRIKDFISSKFPEHHILAEESGGSPITSEPTWIIDPLDGTKNYIHTFPHFAISIALSIDNEIVVGVIYDPIKNDLFYAVRGEGAYRNGEKIRVAEVSDIGYSLIATGFPFRAKDVLDTYLSVFRIVFLKAAGMRRAGSAALDLAYVAAGIFQGFFEYGLSPWDIAAGSLLVSEAGGIVSDFMGSNLFIMTGNTVAGTPKVHEFLVEVTSSIFKTP